MKEKIYTISITEAFETADICPFCILKNKTEAELIESVLGASMMEPDIRIKTNEIGFCAPHYEKLNVKNKALPLALILQTHIKEQIGKLFNNLDLPGKKSLFKRKADEKVMASEIIKLLDKLNKSCYICSRLDRTMIRYNENTIYIWKKEPDFRERFKKAPVFCLHHFSMLLKEAIKSLNQKEFKEFYEVIIYIQKNSLTELYEDITSFANTFDYRNNGPTPKEVRSAIKRAIDIL
jgi:hypothetical protein